jgi:hypothetical protein
MVGIAIEKLLKNALREDRWIMARMGGGLKVGCHGRLRLADIRG